MGGMGKYKKCISILLYILVLVAGTVAFGYAADLNDIKQRKVLRHLCIPYANFVTGSGDGLDVELTQLFSQFIRVRYEYVKTDWDCAIQDLTGRKAAAADGVETPEIVTIRGDIIADGFTVLPWRQRVVAFSEPTFPSQVWLVTRADSRVKPIRPTRNIDRDIALTRALMKGKKVLTVEGTCLDPTLYELSATGAQIVNFKGQVNELAPAILSNEAEMTLLDAPDALVALEKWPGRIKIIGPISPMQFMAAAFNKDAPHLLAAYNRFLSKIKKDGTYMKLVNKYYPSAKMYFPEFFTGLK